MTTHAPYPVMDGTQPCRLSPEDWTPENPTKAGLQAAADVCKTACRFREDCLAFALTRPVLGVWGGMSDAQRRMERSKRGLTLAKDIWDDDSPIRTTSSSTSCSRGHERCPDNAYRDSKGYWQCRPCRRVTEARRNAERREANVVALIPVPRRSPEAVAVSA